MSHLAASDPRVTAAQIKNIFPTDLDNLALDSFAQTVHTLVVEELAGEGLSEVRLTSIELYLSAHYATLADPRNESESVAGEWTFKTQGKTGMFLESSHYGQTALMLDSSGILDGLNTPLQQARIDVLTEV